MLLIVLMLVGIARAMERECAPVSFKSLEGAPVISLYNGKKWFEKLSKEKQQRIYEQIESQKDERLTALLRVVALPQDIQRLIVASFFEDVKKVTDVSQQKAVADYTKAVDIFCKIPLCDALNQYGLSERIFYNPKESFLADNSFPFHVIFEHAPDIKMYHDVMERYAICFSSKKELEGVARVQNMLGDVVLEPKSSLRYQFYNKHITFNKFKKQCFVELAGQILLLSNVVSAYIYLMFPFKWELVRSQGNIEYNAAADDLNKAIEIFNNKVRHLNQKSGSGYEDRSYTQGYREETLIFHGWEYKLFPVLFGGASAGIFFARNSWWLQLAMKNFREKNDSQKAYSILATLFGMGSVYKVMSYIAAQFEENSFYGAGCVASLYMLLCSCYNVYKVKSLQKDSVMLKDIPQLLQRTDIEIV